MLIIVYWVASQRGGPEWPWVTGVTPHSIVDTFYQYLLAVKLTQGPLSPPILFIVTFTALKSSRQWLVWTQGGSLAISYSYLDILWLAANVGNYFKIRGNQSNDYTLITASLMIMIIMTLPDLRLLPPPLRATFCLFESLDLDWCEVRRAGTGATGQSLLPWPQPLLHWPPHYEARCRSLIHSPPDARTRAESVLFSLGLTNGRTKVRCADDGFGILQQNRWETATLQHCSMTDRGCWSPCLSLLRPCFPSFVCQHRVIGPDSR